MSAKSCVTFCLSYFLLCVYHRYFCYVITFRCKRLLSRKYLTASDTAFANGLATVKLGAVDCQLTSSFVVF